MKILYQPHLKEVLRKILQDNPDTWLEKITEATLEELGQPRRLSKKIITLVAYHNPDTLGRAYRTKTRINVLGSVPEMEKTQIHEIIHLIKPSWTDKEVENKTLEIYHNIKPRELVI